MNEKIDNIDLKYVIKRLLKIRFFEESLDLLFSKGIIFGTYHRCIGQEATAVGVTYHLNRDKDFVVSNHRNHGHYLAFTEDFLGLYEELKGTEKGVSKGRGGSQVIFGKNFLSNGILGSTVPIATGISLGLKRRGLKACVVCFLGDGALCEGVVYEAFNMASLWKLPILYVIEYNHVAQTADLTQIMAGSIVDRFKAFNISVTHLESTDVFEIAATCEPIIQSVKESSLPKALVIEADRLCAHSKGDDFRPKELLDKLSKKDPVLQLKKYTRNFDDVMSEAYSEIQKLIDS